MKKLIAKRPVLYLGRMYDAGDTLPANDQKMVTAWLNAKSAEWGRQEAEEKIRRAHTEVEQWLHKVNAGYDLLRSDMGGAITRTGQELDRLRQLLEQLSAHFDTQDEHLRKLSQDCVSDFTPPTPLPLEEQ